jgi:hypothetical protein
MVRSKGLEEHWFFLTVGTVSDRETLQDQHRANHDTTGNPVRQPML